LLASLSGIGLYPVYQQKDQAGLRIVDRDGRDMYSFDRPERVYPSYSSIPARNPAVEWDRLGKAVLDYSHTVDRKHQVGGSTPATQLEKLEPSRTSSAVTSIPFRRLLRPAMATCRAWATACGPGMARTFQRSIRCFARRKRRSTRIK
jgi:hypothetical protein